jgi:hypothetical protein
LKKAFSEAGLFDRLSFQDKPRPYGQPGRMPIGKPRSRPATFVALLIELKAQFQSWLLYNRCLTGHKTCEMVNKSSKVIFAAGLFNQSIYSIPSVRRGVHDTDNSQVICAESHITFINYYINKKLWGLT